MGVRNASLCLVMVIVMKSLVRLILSVEREVKFFSTKHVNLFRRS